MIFVVALNIQDMTNWCLTNRVNPSRDVHFVTDAEDLLVLQDLLGLQNIDVRYTTLAYQRKDIRAIEKMVLVVNQDSK